MDTDQNNKIIELLTEIRDLLKHPATAFEDNTPWGMKLVHEQTMGDDRDGNNLLYGHDFIFSERIDHHPPFMAMLATELSSKWTGTKMTFLEYYKTLPDGPTKSRMLDFLRKQDGR